MKGVIRCGVPYWNVTSSSVQLSSSQEVVEAEAEAEIRLFQHQKEEKERLEREMVAERERLAREREEMGATWGMGEGRAGGHCTGTIRHVSMCMND